jgi:integrase
MLRQMDIIGEWAKVSAYRKLPDGITTLEHKGDIWAGFFTWEMIAGWRWRMKTSKSKYRSAADFDLARFPEHNLLLPLLEAVPHADRTGAVVKGEKNLPVRQAMYARWWRRIARAAGIPDAVWNMDARAGAATEADESGAELDAIQAQLTHSKGSTTLRYIRRGRTRKIELVAEARAKKRASEGGENAN